MKFRPEFIETLTQIKGISGQEERVTQYLYRELKDYCDDVQFDNLGSIIFIKASKEVDAPKLMIAAHMDQIGFLITHIDEMGFCYIKPMGGWWPTLLLSQEVSVTTEDGKEWIGIIGYKPDRGIKEKGKVEFTDIYIDFGVSNKEEILGSGIQVGDAVAPVSRYKKLCNPRYVATCAWDDRVGCAILGELLRDLVDEELPCNLYLVGTVQEEIGLRGARTASQKINPDACISIDIGSCGDTPGCNSYNSTVALGKGPTISILDAAALGNRKFISLAKECATQEGVPYQLDIMLKGATDTGEMQKAYDGAVPLTISIPTRYGHSHNSIVHLDDVENTAKLLKKIAKELSGEKLKKLKTWVKSE